MTRRPYASDKMVADKARAMLDAGLPVAAVEVRPDGGILFRFGQPLSGEELTGDPALRKLLEQAEAQTDEIDRANPIRRRV